MDAINPATGQLIGSYAEHDAAEVDRRLTAARRAYESWRAASFETRGARLRAVAGVLRAQAVDLARLMTLEMGKPIAAAESEVEKCAWVCEHYAEHAAHDLAERPAPTEAARSYVRFEPLGVVLAVMPWNFPLWQVFRCAAPALAAGNTVALKHASNVPGSALAIERVFREAGFRDGAFVTLLIPSGRVPPLLADPRIAAASVTGSEPAGAAVAAAAGQAIKKTVLELGGSDPFVVLDDADPAWAADQAAAARTINNGESCIAAKRFIVAESIAPAFEARLAAAMAALVVGDPLERTTAIGPLARPDLVDALDDQVRRSIAAGARLLTGGARRPGPGCFYTPTVLAGVVPGMAAFDEETFGPVAAVTGARDEAHAIALANQSRFGLGASVWTTDPAGRGERVAAALEAGCVFVNAAVKSDPRVPFGGVKASGYGRELAAFGIREFTNVKTIWRA